MLLKSLFAQGKYYVSGNIGDETLSSIRKSHNIITLA